MIAAGSRLFEFFVGSAVGSFGAGFAQDVVLLGAEELAPFVIAFDDLAGGFRGFLGAIDDLNPDFILAINYGRIASSAWRKSSS